MALPYTIRVSTSKDKKYDAVFKDKVVSFGAKGYAQYKDKTPLRAYASLDHNDEKRKKHIMLDMEKLHQKILQNTGRIKY